jgi:hypothetical protein
MGADPYWYFVPYEDPKIALRKLRQREFKAGRYYPAVDRPRFTRTKKPPSPGAQHKSIKEALADADSEGTHSILDIARISPTPKFLCASPYDSETILKVLGHNKPTHEEIIDPMNIFHLFRGSTAAKLFI